MLALSRVYDPRVIRIAACIAIVVSFCPKFAALVSAMPTATIGGVSLVLYGMISAVGILPGKDYTFEQDDKGATSVDFKV